MSQEVEHDIGALKNTLNGNEYVHTEKQFAFTVQGIERSIYGELWICTDSDDFIESDWWDLRQTGVIERID